MTCRKINLPTFSSVVLSSWKSLYKIFFFNFFPLLLCIFIDFSFISTCPLHFHLSPNIFQHFSFSVSFSFYSLSSSYVPFLPYLFSFLVIANSSFLFIWMITRLRHREHFSFFFFFAFHHFFFSFFLFLKSWFISF